MNKNKGDAGNIAGFINLEHQLTMPNHTLTPNIFQLDLFTAASCERPKKILETIQCGDCHHTRPLDGYRFGLMPLCSDCRTDREVEITGKRFERRRAQR